jgi:ABC-type sugar transport system ATPase subunit
MPLVAPTEVDTRLSAAKLLSVVQVSKRFGAIEALTDVSLDACAGEVLALCGENGAGKSTLVKMLMGIHAPDSGRIEINGRPVVIDGPQTGQALGIALVSQELSLAPDLSVEDNIWLGSADVPLLLRRETLRRRAADVAATLGFDAGVLDTPVSELSMAERQLVEIARNLCRDARILILDEPTATLSDVDIERLFGAIRGLRAKGCAVLYITHRLGEVFELCDRATVLRNGRLVGSAPTAELDRERLVEMMISEKIGDVYHQRPASASSERRPLLAVRDLSVPGLVHGLSLDVRPGQIVGIAGQIGSGAAEVVRALAGLVPSARARIELDERPLRLGARHQMLDAGLAFISEDRASEGLFLKRAIRENLVATSIARLCRRGVLSWKRLDATAAHAAAQVGVDQKRMNDIAGVLSGGNQQKIAFGRCIEPGDGQRPRLVLMNEPTRGVDIGARSDLYKLMRDFCSRDIGIVLHTTDLEEMLGLADVIVTMYRGRLANVYARHEATLPRVVADITHAGDVVDAPIREAA